MNKKNNKNDPDIIRWSTLKRFALNTLGWFVFIGVVDWGTNMSGDLSTTGTVLWWLGFSIFLGWVTDKSNN